MEMCIADDDKQGYYICLYENWVLEILDLFFFYLSSIAKVILDVFSYMANIVLGKKKILQKLDPKWLTCLTGLFIFRRLTGVMKT